MIDPKMVDLILPTSEKHPITAQSGVLISRWGIFIWDDKYYGGIAVEPSISA